MSRDEPPPPLRSVTEFAAEQAEFLKVLFGITTDQELASLTVIKLQEEAGEVAEAFLALRGMQRHDKIGQPEHALKTSLGREIADVAVVMALLADAIGLAFDEVLLDRIDDLRVRREKLLAEANPQRTPCAHKPDVPLPTDTPPSAES